MTQLLMDLFSHSVAVGIDGGALQRAVVCAVQCPLRQEQIHCLWDMMEGPTEAGALPSSVELHLELEV